MIISTNKKSKDTQSTWLEERFPKTHLCTPTKRSMTGFSSWNLTQSSGSSQSGWRSWRSISKTLTKKSNSTITRTKIMMATFCICQLCLKMVFTIKSFKVGSCSLIKSIRFGISAKKWSICWPMRNIPPTLLKFISVKNRLVLECTAVTSKVSFLHTYAQNSTNLFISSSRFPEMCLRIVSAVISKSSSPRRGKS